MSTYSTFAELVEAEALSHDDLRQSYSDLHKQAYGCRASSEGMTTSELVSAIQSIGDYMSTPVYKAECDALDQYNRECEAKWQAELLEEEEATRQQLNSIW